MKTSPDKLIKAKIPEQCICSDIGELLPDYILNLLSDLKAEELEEHLLFCRRCRNDYLRIVRIRSAARAARRRHMETETPDGEGAEILSMADFKKI